MLQQIMSTESQHTIPWHQSPMVWSHLHRSHQPTHHDPVFRQTQSNPALYIATESEVNIVKVVPLSPGSIVVTVTWVTALRNGSKNLEGRLTEEAKGEGGKGE